MTPYEYKAWFDAFTKSDRTSPSLAKWAVINDRVADIDGFALTRDAYIREFAAGLESEATDHRLLEQVLQQVAPAWPFDGEQAMRTLGDVQSWFFASKNSDA